MCSAGRAKRAEASQRAGPVLLVLLTELCVVWECLDVHSARMLETAALLVVTEGPSSAGGPAPCTICSTCTTITSTTNMVTSAEDHVQFKASSCGSSVLKQTQLCACAGLCAHGRGCCGA